jgi:hypothetical protein
MRSFSWVILGMAESESVRRKTVQTSWLYEVDEGVRIPSCIGAKKKTNY